MKFGKHLLENQFPPWANEYIQYNQLKHFIKERPRWTQADELYFSETLTASELNKVNGFIHLKMKQVGTDAKKIYDLIQFININDVGFYKILKKHDKWAVGYPPLLSSIRFHNIHHQFQSYVAQLNGIQKTHIDSTKEEKIEQATTTTTIYWVHMDNLTELQAILLFHIPVTSSNIINTVYFDGPEQFSLYSGLLERNENAETIRARWYTDNTNAGTQPIYIERKRHHESWIHNKGSYTKERFQLNNYDQVDRYIQSGHNCKESASKSIYSTIQKVGARSTLRSYHHRTTYNSAHTHPYYITLDTRTTLIKEYVGNTAYWARNDVLEYPFNDLKREELFFFPYAILQIKSTSPNTAIPVWLTQMVETSKLVYEVPYFSEYLHGTCHFFRDKLPLLPWWLGEMKTDIRRKGSRALNQSQQSNNGGGCVTMETPSIPDYLNVALTEPPKLCSNTASSYSIILDDSHIGLTSLTNNKAAYAAKDNSDDKKPSAYDMFASSEIVTKIKTMMNKSSLSPEQKPANYVGMLKWILARVTNDKSVLESPQYPSAQPVLSARTGKSPNLKKKIEPKIFFSNERTFISWLQFSALLLSVSLGLINFGDHVSRASGGLFVLIAIILAGYAHLRFQYRAWQIRCRGDSRFDDILGPAVLCLVLIVALFVNLVLRIKQPLPENPSPFGKDHSNNTNNTVSVNNTTLIIKNHPLPNGTRVDTANGKIIQSDDGHFLVFDNDSEEDDD